MRRGPLLLAVALVLFYLGTFGGLDDGMVLGNDAVPYAAELARGESHANPHHLLFHPLAQLVKALLAPLEHESLSLRGPMGLAMTAQVLLSALGGALAAAAFLWSAARITGARAPRLTPWALTALLALSAGHWLYASVGETYLPAIAAQTGLLGLALVARLERGGQADTRGQLAMAALLLLAVLLRQDSVLVVVAVAVLLRPRPALLVIGTAGIAALTLYLGAWLGTDTGTGFVAWLRGLADTGLWGGGLDATRLRVSGTLSLAALAYPVYYAGQASLAGGVGLEQGLLELALGLAPWLLLVLAVVAGRSRGAVAEPGDLPHRRLALLALVLLLALRLAFFTWWQPGNLEYHTGHLAPLLLLVAVLLRPAREAPGPAADVVPRLLLLAAAVTLVGNWLTLIEPNRTPAMHAVAAEALEHVAPGGLVLSLDRLGHYANLRAAGTTARALDPAPKIMDASDVASGLDLARLKDLRWSIGKAIERVGADPDAAPAVIATRDRILPPRFEHAPWPLDWSTLPGADGPGHEGGMNRLIEGHVVLPLDPTAGTDAGVWILRRGGGGQ